MAHNTWNIIPTICILTNYSHGPRLDWANISHLDRLASLSGPRQNHMSSCKSAACISWLQAVYSCQNETHFSLACPQSYLQHHSSHKQHQMIRWQLMKLMMQLACFRFWRSSISLRLQATPFVCAGKDGHHWGRKNWSKWKHEDANVFQFFTMCGGKYRYMKSMPVYSFSLPTGTI